ncbi:MAG: hypothetical protein ACOCWS_01885, partial [Alkalispirochaetaceae bacterium]
GRDATNQGRRSRSAVHPWHSRAYAFLRREEWTMRKLATLIREGESGWREAEKLLREHDYITFYFPDPEPRQESSYLRRVIASASYFLRHCIWPEERGGESPEPP